MSLVEVSGEHFNISLNARINFIRGGSEADKRRLFDLLVSTGNATGVVSKVGVLSSEREDTGYEWYADTLIVTDTPEFKDPEKFLAVAAPLCMRYNQVFLVIVYAEGVWEGISDNTKFCVYDLKSNGEELWLELEV